MDKKEVAAFIALNLKVKVKVDNDGDIEVALLLMGEEISTDWTPVPKDE